MSSKKIFMKTFGEMNTFLGGVGATILTREELASRFDIPLYYISRFRIVGTEIHCRINYNYSLGVSAFNNTEGRYLSSFIDPEGKCTNFGITAFKTVNNLMTEIYAPGIITQTGTSIFQDTLGAAILNMPNCLSVPSNMFGNWNGAGKLLKFPKVVSYGATQTNNNVFTVNNKRATVEAAISNQTSNGGNIEGDLQTVIDNATGSVIWV